MIPTPLFLEVFPEFDSDNFPLDTIPLSHFTYNERRTNADFLWVLIRFSFSK